MMVGQHSVAILRTLPCVLLGLSLVGCAEDESKKMAIENVLKLELGGDYGSLAAALRYPPPGYAPRGAPPKNPQPKNPQPKKSAEDSPPAIHTPERRPQPHVPQPEQPKPRPLRPEKKKPPEFHVVRLAEGQNLYRLCKQHLGNGGRWKEVARLNGWSEASVHRLPAGQKVKLPVR